MDDMDEIVREFLVESYENLDQLDRDLIALESEPGSRALLSSVFRTIHTIKGTSGFLALTDLERVSHAGENLLVELRDGQRLMDEPTTSVLLAMADTVRSVLAGIEAGDGRVVAVDPTIELITRLQARERAEPEPAGAAAPVPPPPHLVPNPPPAPGGGAEPAGAAAAPRRAAESAIRVDVDLLDSLMRQVGELVLVRNQVDRLAQSGEDADVLRDRVTSPNGTTYAGLQAMKSANFRDTIRATILAARDRSSELAKGS